MPMITIPIEDGLPPLSFYLNPLDAGRFEAFLASRKSSSQLEKPIAAASEIWEAITEAGQVKVGDYLQFKIGDRHFRERAKQILQAGTDKEEVIYDKSKNFYFITSMIINGGSNHKNVERWRGKPSSPWSSL